MLKKSIAIIRGGDRDNIRSLQNGLNLIKSLMKYLDELEIVDVTLDLEGNWFLKGVPSSPHKVFSQVDYYLDLTNNLREEYQDLAKRLKVRSVLEDTYGQSLGRINQKRILKQLKVPVTKYHTLRDRNNLKYNLKEIWSKLSTPIVVKEDKHKLNESSLMTASFLEAYTKSLKILQNGGTLILEEHAKGRYVSLGAIPNYRGQDLYLTIPIETLNIDEQAELPNSNFTNSRFLIRHDQQKRIYNFRNEEIKKEIFETVSNLYQTLALSSFVMFDLCLIEDKPGCSLKVIDIHTTPNLFEDSRFDYILKNSGVDIGDLILKRMNR